MIAIEISSFGPPDVLKPVERPLPRARSGEVVIRVAAAGVARADLMQRQGKYSPPPGASDIPGLDVAGTIHELGENAGPGRQVGDRVCAILSGGGYAQYCVAPVEQILPVPDGWDMQEAATLPENLFTVYDSLIMRAGLQRGETALIHGGTSGIGSMAIMLSNALGATAIATAGSDAKCRACLELGARHAINYQEADFVAEVHKATAGRGVNVVLDMVGGAYFERNLEALAIEGRLAIVSTLGGRTAPLDIGKLMAKRLRVMGSMMRARTPAEKGAVAEALRRQVWPLLPGKKHIWPLIDSVYPLADAWRAHERMENGGHIGKIVLLA